MSTATSAFSGLSSCELDALCVIECYYAARAISWSSAAVHSSPLELLVGCLYSPVALNFLSIPLIVDAGEAVISKADIKDIVAEAPGPK